MSDANRRTVLTEMIYRRVRRHVNLCQLLIIERDLAATIERAHGECAGSREHARGRAREYMDEAWRRIEQEWHDMRTHTDFFDEMKPDDDDGDEQ